MSEIILSIGIPTFNGEKYLRETINTALIQVLNLNLDCVEIVISDNGSTDNTQKICEEFSENYPSIVKYFRNDINLGFDKNVELLFCHASGKYVEILGDDDYHAEDSIENILNIIKSRRELSVVLLNICYLSIESGRQFGGSEIPSDIFFEDGDAFFQYSKWMTAPVSSIIIRRESFKAICLDKYIGDQWIHIGAILEILAKKCSSVVVSKKSIVVRIGNTRWNSHFGNQLMVGLSHLKVFSNMQKLGYLDETYNYFLNYRYKSNLKDIINLAPFSFYERIKIAKLMIDLFQKKSTFWMIHLPTLLMLSYPFQISKFLIKKSLLSWSNKSNHNK